MFIAAAQSSRRLFLLFSFPVDPRRRGKLSEAFITFQFFYSLAESTGFRT